MPGCAAISRTGSGSGACVSDAEAKVWGGIEVVQIGLTWPRWRSWRARAA